MGSDVAVQAVEIFVSLNTNKTLHDAEARLIRMEGVVWMEGVVCVGGVQ